MLKLARFPRSQIIARSPLRQVDPRVRLAISLGASLAVMLPLQRLLLFLAFYVMLLLWARLTRPALQQIWRLKWVLLILFIIDWFVVSLDLAIIVTLRVLLLTGSFAFLVHTTTPGELRLVLEWLCVPHRYAFSLSLAFQSVTLLTEEWRAIQEAQRARGAWQPPRWAGWRGLPAQLREMLALTVPAIVLTTRRAWALTESAHARGFDAPHRRSFRQLMMAWTDWLLLAFVACVIVFMVFYF
ncbi:MAG: energy-coupling factor transporter transmembrane protein EcfT [Ardenticatenaceae bacterium]|nr:energy-coupling factor transporter transmembrane protein EcfT [Ardenticatenaceae bacterium]MCB9002766.1 energy-coupling factor transporter transmembrane protein EcfT [Ardenticatenaceae bacterium]